MFLIESLLKKFDLFVMAEKMGCLNILAGFLMSGFIPG